MCAIVGGGFLVFNFVMGHMEGGHGHDGCSHDTGMGGHDTGAHHDVGGHDGGAHHDGGDGHGDHDGGRAEGESTTNRYGLVGVEHHNRLTSRIGRLLMAILSPMSIAIFLAFFGLTGYLTGYLMPWLGYITLIPAFIAGFVMINIFKSCIRALMKYGTSSSHVRSGELIGQVGEVLIPIAENRPGEITYVIQSKIYSSVARASKPGEKINKGTKVMIVETDGPTVFVEPYKDPMALSD